MKNLLFTFIILFIGTSLIAQTTAEEEKSSLQDSMSWSPEKHMEIRGVSGTAISDDGKYVAYVVRTPAMEGEKSEYLSQIWVAATDGSLNVQYTHGDKSSHSPTFSPDGKIIAFLSERAEKTQLFIMRLMGGEAKQITSEKDGIGSIQWSPDSKKIAFLKIDEKSEKEEKIEKEKRDVIEVDKNFKYSHLYTIDVSMIETSIIDTTIQRLTNGNFHVQSFDWSPDGKTIVFAHQADPRINVGFIETDISWVSSDSSAINELITRPGVDRSPIFSPDGKQVAFVTNGGSQQPVGLFDTQLVDFTSGKINPLPLTPSRDCDIINWSSDGAHLYLSEAYKTSYVAMKMSAAPGNRSNPVIITSQDGTAGDFAVANKSDKMVYEFQAPDKPAELYVSSADGGTMTMLSSINTDVALPAMGKTELIKWTSKDGLEIEGLITYPVDYRDGQKVPLVLQIHGGPAGVFTKSFTGNPSIYMTQYFAENGYAVLRPNPRGSTGYSKDFRYANIKDWGFGDYEDVMSGVDKVIEMGVADENRMVVMGWSYGGYLTSFLVTKTNRFKAASMGAGLPNLISMTTTTDIGDYLVGHMGGEFWDDYETYEKHSAMYQIKNVVTPTQVIHGANDLRVPFTQGQEFYRALDRRGVATEMLVLPRTPHGPREPKLLMEVSPRILTWFNKYVEPRS